MTTSLAWVLDPPGDTLKEDFLSRVPRSNLWALLLSSLLSYALAETVLAMPVRGSMETISPVSLFFLNLILQTFAYFSGLGIMFGIAQLVRRQPTPFPPAFSISLAAIVPLHLTLPIALICRALGSGGLVIYAIAELALWAVVIRRWAIGLQNLYAWPEWAGILIVLSPLILGCIAFLFFTVVILAGLALLLVGLLV